MVDTMVWDTVDTTDTDTLARGPLMPNLRPHPKPMLMLPLPTMVDTMVDTAVMDTVLDTVDTMVVMLVILIVLTDTDTTTARGLLMPNLRLMLMPLLMPTTDTTAVDTDTELMALDTDMVDTVDTMAVDTDTVTDTETTVKFLLNCKFLKPYFLSYN